MFFRDDDKPANNFMSRKMISSPCRSGGKDFAMIPYLVADNGYMPQPDHSVYNLSQITSSNRLLGLAYYCFRVIYVYQGESADIDPFAAALRYRDRH
jgi:hypothetical protein